MKKSKEVFKKEVEKIQDKHFRIGERDFILRANRLLIQESEIGKFIQTEQFQKIIGNIFSKLNDIKKEDIELDDNGNADINSVKINTSSIIDIISALGFTFEFNSKICAILLWPTDVDGINKKWNIEQEESFISYNATSEIFNEVLVSFFGIVKTLMNLTTLIR